MGEGRRGFSILKAFFRWTILPLGVLEDDSWLQKIPQQYTNSSALVAFVSSNPIILHTPLPQYPSSSSPAILNNTHKTNSHLLHKNIAILAAQTPKKQVKPSR
jgi:hypothetical protein